MITYNTTRLKVVTRLEVVETKYVLGIHRPGNTASQGHANTQSVSITYYVPSSRMGLRTPLRIN